MEWPESIKRKADALNDRVVELLKKTPVSVNNATAFAEWLAQNMSPEDRRVVVLMLIINRRGALEWFTPLIEKAGILPGPQGTIIDTREVNPDPKN